RPDGVAPPLPRARPPSDADVSPPPCLPSRPPPLHFSQSAINPTLHSFPTRRSSDLTRGASALLFQQSPRGERAIADCGALQTRRDRKSTRLNSSHLGISYAVFCLKKKNNTESLSLEFWMVSVSGTLAPASIMAAWTA